MEAPDRDERLWQVTSPYFCAGLATIGDRVVFTAPILRRHVQGQSWSRVRDLFRLKRWKVVEVNSAALKKLEVDPNDRRRTTDGRWIVSPSQLKRFDDKGGKSTEGCERAWGFRYMEGHPEPERASSVLGKRCHKWVEDYLQNKPHVSQLGLRQQGVTDDLFLRENGCTCTTPTCRLKCTESKIMMAGLDLLPQPSAELEVEGYFLFERHGYVYRGYIDLECTADGDHKVIDHKTSKNPKRYGLTALTLPQDLQANIYAARTMELRGTEVCHLQWDYHKTVGKPEAYPVRATLTKEESDANFDNLVHPVADRLHKIGLAARTANELKPNFSACGAFGGCPHADRCDRGSLSDIFHHAESIGRKKENGKGNGKGNEQMQGMSLEDMLDGAISAPAKDPSAAEAPPPSGTSTAPSTEATAPTSETSPAQTGAAASGSTPSLDDLMGGGAPQTTQINSPESVDDAKVEKEASIAVGDLEGGPAEKKAKSREIGDAIATGEAVADVVARQKKEGEDKAVSKSKSNKKGMKANEVWLNCASCCGGDVDKTEALFKAYCARWPFKA